MEIKERDKKRAEATTMEEYLDACQTILFSVPLLYREFERLRSDYENGKLTHVELMVRLKTLTSEATDALYKRHLKQVEKIEQW